MPRLSGVLIVLTLASALAASAGWAGSYTGFVQLGFLIGLMLLVASLVDAGMRAQPDLPRSNPGEYP